MSSFAGLYTGISGLTAAQAGLYVTGHNMSNAEIPGYVRQRVLQSDFMSRNMGVNHYGSNQIGMGTDIDGIRQIRDEFLDLEYRKHVGRSGFYNKKYEVGAEILEVMGELEGAYKLSDTMDDLYSALHGLSMDPAALDTRRTFASTLKSFVEKSKEIYDNLYSYQTNLNDQVKEQVTEINQLLNKVDEVNDLIFDAEAAGDSANDYRDIRNNALDELSKMLQITYREHPNGKVTINYEGTFLLTETGARHIGLRYTSEDRDFVEPVMTSSTETLSFDPADEFSRPLFNWSREISTYNENDYGSLKALLLTRGFKSATYMDSPEKIQQALNDQAGLELNDPNRTVYPFELFNVENCMIPKAMMEIDTLVSSLVKQINDAFAPTADDGTGKIKSDPDAPYGTDLVTQGFELVVRKAPGYEERYDEITGELIADERDDVGSWYSITNIEVNPELDDPFGYNKIGTQYKDAGESDNRNVLNDLLATWNNQAVGVDGEDKVSIQDFYRRIVMNIGTETNEAENIGSKQDVQTLQADNKRQMIMGVSMDEELRNMMLYQHAYNAAARVTSIIDSMIDKVVNGTGRVGL